MKPNPFFSGFVCGVALTLASVIVFVTYHKEMAAPPAKLAANPLIPASGAINLAGHSGAGTNSPALGPISAPVTIVDFSDFYCGFCKKVYPTLMQIAKAYPDKVRIIFKNMPLAVTPGQGSYFAHEVGVCAQEQGKFWPFFEAVFGDPGRPDPAAVRQIASKVGMNTQLMESCLKSERPKKTIDAHLSESASKNINGTPTFLINGEMLAGAYPYETFKTKIDAILSGKQPPLSAPPVPQLPKIVEFTDLQGRPSLGSEKAPVTLVEFSDFHCPFCKKLEPVMDQIMQNYPDKVRRVWRHFPLDMHQGAARTHQASECANEQGKFWEYENKLFENLGAQKDDALLISLAEKSDLKMKDFKRCLEAQSSKDMVQKDIQKGKASGVQGTPAVFVNGRIVKGAQPFESFKRVIDEELQKAAQPSKK